MEWGILVRNLYFVVTLVKGEKHLSVSHKRNRTAPAHSSVFFCQGECEKNTELAQGAACMPNHPSQQSEAREGECGSRRLEAAAISPRDLTSSCSRQTLLLHQLRS